MTGTDVDALRSRTVQVVDAWIQPWNDVVVDALPPQTANVVNRYGEHRLMNGVPIEEMLDELRASPVDLALVSGGPATPMSEVLRCLDLAPDLMIGVAWTDPVDGIMKAVRELEQLVKDYPICGFKLEPFYLRRNPTDRIFYPLYAKCEELGLTLQTQVGGTGPLFPSRTGLPLHIDEVALDFPDLRIVCGHVGSPWVDEMIHVAWKHENVYIDTSARMPRLFEPSFAKYLRTYGQDKCIFATDWPLLDYTDTVKQVDALELKPDVADKFLAGNAVSAFGLDRFGIEAAPRG